MNRHHMLLAGREKVALYGVMAIVVAWILLGTTAISDFFTFCLSGVVPGTHYVLSPNAVIYTAAVCLGLLALVLAVRLHAAHIRRQIGPIWTAKDNTDSPRTQETALQAAEILQRQYYPEVTRRTRIRLALVAWQSNGYDAVASFAVVFGDALRAAASGALVLAARLFIGGFIAVGLLIRQIIGTGNYLFQQTQDMWRAAEPFLWRFDGWLESRALAIHDSISARLSRYEFIKHLQTIVQSYKKETGFFGGVRHSQEHSAAIDPIIKAVPDVADES